MKASEFAQEADPHSWLLVADNLYEQSLFLYQQFSLAKLTKLDGRGAILGEWPRSNRATFLLAGFALENAIKAFLVYENPEWVSQGMLAKPLRSHRLAELSNMSSLIPWKKKGPAILSRFEEGLESWARYPCGLYASGTQHEQNLPDALWIGYLGLMKAYGRELMNLLQQGWEGPHGVGGRFVFQTSYLGAVPKRSLGLKQAAMKSTARRMNLAANA